MQNLRSLLIIASLWAAMSGLGCGPELPAGLRYLDAQDARLTDPEYRWVQTLALTSHCVKCHSSEHPTFPESAPKAIKIFDIDRRPFFLDSASDEVLHKLLLTKAEGGRRFPDESPSDDFKRFEQLVHRELARRTKARNAASSSNSSR